MPLVKMTKTMKGSNDGLSVKEYQQGKIYAISEGLYRGFSELDVCVVVKDKDNQKSKETKAEAPDETKDDKKEKKKAGKKEKKG